MKLFPAAAVTITCAALLVSCGHKASESTGADQQAQERLADEQLAEQQRQLHEQQAALDERERILNEREQQLTVAAPSPSAPSSTPPPVAAQPPPASPDASYQAFYDYLSPYGAWVQMASYGYVWQPSATVQDYHWRPYTLGHWAYTDDGWTWISDEPFGWITYHYGRWMRTHTLNWVWVPAGQWAPAWVSWRYGNDFVGWAPLPPEARFDGAAGIQQWADQQYSLGASDYTFVPASEFGEESMASVQVPPDQNEPIYDESNNVTNIYYGADDTGDYGVICYGPAYEFLRAKSHRPLPPKFRIKRGGFQPNGNHSAFISGDTLQVTAPRIVAGPAAPRTVGKRVVDARVVSPVSAPPPHGSLLPPLYRPPQTAANAPANATAPAPERAVESVRPSGAPQAGSGATDIARTGQPPSSDIDAQKAHDLAIIQQEQAAEQERQRKEADLAAEEQQAKQQRAAEKAAHAAAQHAAAEEQSAKAAREEAARQVQPGSVPASTQAAGQGRGSPY